jgi:hypothetical protein
MEAAAGRHIILAADQLGLGIAAGIGTLCELATDFVDIAALVAAAQRLIDFGLSIAIAAAAGVGCRDGKRDLAVAQRIEDAVRKVGKRQAAAHEALGETEADRDVLWRPALIFDESWNARQVSAGFMVRLKKFSSRLVSIASLALSSKSTAT